MVAYLPKAFDYINHKRVMAQLFWYGIHHYQIHYIYNALVQKAALNMVCHKDLFQSHSHLP